MRSTKDFAISCLGPSGINVRASPNDNRKIFDGLKSTPSIAAGDVLIVLTPGETGDIERYNNICLFPAVLTDDNKEAIRQCLEDAKAFINGVTNVSLESFLAGRASLRTASIDSIKRDLDKAKSNFEKALKAVKAAESEIKEYARRMEAAERYDRESLQNTLSLNTGIENLLEVCYDKIKFAASDKLICTTKEIAIDYNGKVWRFAPITFELYIKEAPIINVLNPNTSGKPTHPHVSRSGTVCFGTWLSQFNDILSSDNFDLRIIDGLKLIHDIFSHYNPGDNYNRIDLCFSETSNNEVDSWYNDCLKSVKPNIHCVSACSDNKCPFFANRFERCFKKQKEDNSFVNCIACGKCETGKKWAEEMAKGAA